MDAKAFVDITKEMAINDSVEFVQSNLIRPTGRKPDETLVAMSQWYNGLKDNEKSLLLHVI
jgi:hypothetical protein